MNEMQRCMSEKEKQREKKKDRTFSKGASSILPVNDFIASDAAGFFRKFHALEDHFRA